MRHRMVALFLGLLCVMPSASYAIDARVTVMQGEGSLIGMAHLSHPDTGSVGSFLFVVHEEGIAAGDTGVSEGAWFEAALYLDGGPVRAFGGPVDADQVALDPVGGGSVRLPLGDLGEATLVVDAGRPEILPVGCVGMSIGFLPLMREWSANAHLTYPSRSNVHGTVAGFAAEGRDPTRSDPFLPFVFLSGSAVARVRDITPPQNPLPFSVGVGVGCV